MKRRTRWIIGASALALLAELGAWGWRHGRTFGQDLAPPVAGRPDISTRNQPDRTDEAEQPPVERDPTEVVANLVVLGPAGVPELIELLHHADPAVQHAAIRGLGRLGPDAREAAEPLLKLAKPYQDVEAFPGGSTCYAVSAEGRLALRALGRIGPFTDRVVPALVDAHRLTRDDAYLDAVSRMGRPAVPDLLKLLRDRDSGRRETACEALGRIGPAAREAVADLLEARRRGGVEGRSAAFALLRIGGRSNLALAELRLAGSLPQVQVVWRPQTFRGTPAPDWKVRIEKTGSELAIVAKPGNMLERLAAIRGIAVTPPLAWRVPGPTWRWDTQPTDDHLLGPLFDNDWLDERALHVIPDPGGGLIHVQGVNTSPYPYPYFAPPVFEPREGHEPRWQLAWDIPAAEAGLIVLPAMSGWPYPFNAAPHLPPWEPIGPIEDPHDTLQLPGAPQPSDDVPTERRGPGAL